MLSPQTKRIIYRIIPFGLFWLFFSILYVLMEKGLLGEAEYYPSTGNPYDFTSNLLITASVATITGLLFGTIEILYLNKVFAQKSFSKKIAYKTIIYAVIMIVFLLVTTIINNSIDLQTNIFDKAVWENVWAFFSNFVFWSIQIYIAVIVGISLFYNEVSDNLGQEVLYNFFTGKYHQPIEEERIFMFLDMKSSTTIAEKLGHVKYFQMLREYYSDLSDPVIQYAGEIYQYVGDEIIVSWKLQKGIQNNNCINCFFEMKAALKKQAKKYETSYGVSPTFKAGFHYGKVTTGEIGVIKQDIIFTGDVLNTTARIQGLCNTYEVDNLLSDALIKQLNLNPVFQSKNLGESALRGRDEKVELFTISLI